MNPRTIWSIVSMEVSMDRRLARYWIFLIIAMIFVISSMLGNFFNYYQISAVSSSAFFYSPLMLPFSSFPTLITFLPFGILFLAFDILSRDRSSRIDEVYTTLPISNFEFVTGRALGVALVYYIPAAIAIALYFVIGLIMDLSMPEQGFQHPEPFITLATLIMDLMPTFLFWASVIIFLTIVLRFRVLVALVGLGILGLMIWFQNSLPIAVLNLLGTVTVGLIFPSELSPQFTNSAIILQRVGVISLSFALLYVSAILIPRQDGTNRTMKLGIASSLTVVATLSFFGSHVLFNSPLDSSERYLAIHEKSTTYPQIDIDSMSGIVEIDPGGDINIDIALSAKLTRSLSASQPLVFSLNPGLKIQSLAINDRPATHDFSDGLLQIDSDNVVQKGEEIELEITAEGELDPSFAYFDSAVDLYKDFSTAVAGLLFLGTESAINNSDYMTLIPDLAWYPLSGTKINRDQKAESPRDFFNLDLVVVIPDDWHVAGPGTPEIESRSNARIVQFSPDNPVHEVALFAAEFERRTRTIAGIEFELLVDPAHTRNLDLFAPILPRLDAEVVEIIERGRSAGLDYPYQTYTIVEVPVNLRTFRGGWRMDTAQSYPGVFTLREGTFLSAIFVERLDELRLNEELTDEEKETRELAYLQRYFNNDVSGGNIFVAATSNLFQFQTDSTGPGAIPLSYVMDYLAANLIAEFDTFFSVHILKNISSLSTANVGMFQMANTESDGSLASYFYANYINQPANWDALLNQPFGTTQYADKTKSEDNLHRTALTWQRNGSLNQRLVRKRRSSTTAR